MVSRRARTKHRRLSDVTSGSEVRFRGVMRRVGRGSGVRGDTPVKTTLSRRGKPPTFLPTKHFDALPEEPESETATLTAAQQSHHIAASRPPACCSSATPPACCSSATPPACCSSATPPNSPENLRQRATAPVGGVPAARRGGLWATAALHAAQTPAEGKRSCTVTPVSTTGSSTEADSTFSSGCDGAHCCSSTSTSSSSLSSPEVFRQENRVESFSFPVEDLLSPLLLKNSTLLDASHAETLRVHQPPGLSTILDSSSILLEQNSSDRGEGEVEQKTQRDPCQSGKTLKERTPLMSQRRVWFKSPLIAEALSPRVGRCREGEASCQDRSLPLTVTPKGTAKRSPRTATVLHLSDGERDEFLQRAGERCTKLRRFTFFPSRPLSTRDVFPPHV